MGRKIFQNGVWYHMEKKIKYDTEYMARELIELCPKRRWSCSRSCAGCTAIRSWEPTSAAGAHRKGRSGRICCASSKRTATPPTWRWQLTACCWKTKIAREKTRDNTAKTRD